MAKISTFASKKLLKFCTFTEPDFSAWQRCTGYRANLKVCTNTKKVDNHWSRAAMSNPRPVSRMRPS